MPRALDTGFAAMCLAIVAAVLVDVSFVQPAGVVIDVGARAHALGLAAVRMLPAAATVTFFLGVALVSVHVRAGDGPVAWILSKMVLEAAAVLVGLMAMALYTTYSVRIPRGRLMAQLPAYLPSAAKFALTVAIGCAYILKPILDFINAMSPRSPVLDAAVAVVLVSLPATYLMGVTLVYLHVTPLPAAAPGASRWFADLACTSAFALLVALAAFLFLAMVGSPRPASGFMLT